MNKPNPPKLNKPQRFIKYMGACLGLSGALLAGSASATNYYLDVNGTTAGYGGANGGSYSWEGTNWTTSSGNTATTTWTQGQFPRFDMAFNYTVTIGATEQIAGLYQEKSNIVTFNGTGSGNLSITAGQQGFLQLYSVGTACIFNVPLTGPGGFVPEGGDLYMNGINTYSGGTFLDAGTIYLSNNSSLGTGPLSYYNGASGITGPFILVDTNTTSVTLPNGFYSIGANGAATTNELILITGAANSVTFSGPWTNSPGWTWLTVGNTPNPTSKVILSGPIYGGATGNFYKDGPGTLTLNSADTNTAQFLVANGTLEIGAGGSFVGPLSLSATNAHLKLDTSTSLATVATLNLVTGLTNGAINLNFTGSDTVHALYIGNVLQGSGTYGSSTSGAQTQLPIFTGSGTITVPAAPVIFQQPEPQAAFPGGTSTFSVVATGASINYQWNFNNAPISGANSSSYTISPVETNNAGTYTVSLSTTAGNITSQGATLTVLVPNFYTETILSNAPLSYWRLDETNGNVADDDVGTNNGIYVNVTLDQPGYSLTDPDTCIGLPANASAGRGFMIVSNASAFNFTAANPFTLEAWVNFTNISGVERILSTFGSSSTTASGWAWGINGNTGMRFTEGGVQDADVTLSNALVLGVWYDCAMVFDGYNYNFYLNGAPVGSVPLLNPGNPLTGALTIGSDTPTYAATAEQVFGRIDEVAIYNTGLSPAAIMGDYLAQYGTIVPPVVSAPIATPGTNYATLTSIIQAVAGGGDLSYQWYMDPSTLLSGQTNAVLTLTNLTMANAGSYYVQVSNPKGTNTSPAVALTVLAIPTNAAQLDLTSGLVLHLPFNGNLTDISGQGNNGTNVGATSFVSPAQIGTSALHYYSDTTVPSYNYVTLGSPADLQFGASDFTVSFWIQQPNGSIYTNLPFFTDAINSTDTTSGYAFAPYETKAEFTEGGGWQWTLNTVSSPNQYTTFSDVNLINDGNWHSMVFVAQRSANMTTYLDGMQVDTQAINYLGNIGTTNAVNVGQDPTGKYAVSGQANINDLAVWTRVLQPLEVSGLYVAGSVNGVSFAPPVAAPPVTNYVNLSIGEVSGELQVSWPGGIGNLQASTNLASGFTNVPSATSPYTVPTNAAATFYRLNP